MCSIVPPRFDESSEAGALPCASKPERLYSSHRTAATPPSELTAMLAGSSSSDGEITLLQPAPRPRAAVSIAWVVVALIGVQASFEATAALSSPRLH